MKLPPLEKGTLLKRYKRFLADIELEDGRRVTAHCPNSGSMLTCSEPGSPVLISRSENPNRKYPYTWELVFTNNVWVGINTNVPNRLVYEAIAAGIIPELTGYDEIKREVKYGENSRIDVLLSKNSRRCYVEVKNVTLAQDDVAYFPDAVTKRGKKHLDELMAMVRLGDRAVMFYLVQRADASIFKPAQHIDPLYSQTLKEAVANGVEILVYQAKVTPAEITLGPPLPYKLD